MPIPGETRMVNGRLQVWVPAASIPKKQYKRTLSPHRENFEVSSIETPILNIIGRGEIREIILVANQKINMTPKIDGVDLFSGRNTFDEIALAALYSKTIEARHDDPNYIIGISGIHFSESVDIEIWADTSAIVSSMICLYDIYGEE